MTKETTYIKAFAFRDKTQRDSLAQDLTKRFTEAGLQYAGSNEARITTESGVEDRTIHYYRTGNPQSGIQLSLDLPKSAEPSKPWVGITVFKSGKHSDNTTVEQLIDDCLSKVKGQYEETTYDPTTVRPVG